MMRWMVDGAMAIAVLVFVVAAIGALLPVKHTASRSTRVALPPGALYTLLTTMKFGDVPVHWERQEPPSLLVSRVDASEKAFGGTWTYRIAPVPGGSELTITEDGEVYNVIFRVMSRFVFGHYATLDAYINNLQTRLEDVKK